MKEKTFKNAKWIWLADGGLPDEYVEFVFNINKQENCVLNITADSNYNVFVNGKLLGFCQPADYPHYKLYDSFKLDNLREGVNEIKILVWYYGIETQTYKKDTAGAIFEVLSNGKTIYSSGENTLSRRCTSYENYREKKLTRQIGFGYKYISCAINEEKFSNSVEVEKSRNFHLRPIKLLTLGKPVAVDIKECDGYYLVDMHEETVGFLSFDIQAHEDTSVTVAYGEYLTEEGGVNRTLNGIADFSIELALKKGANAYTDHFRRLAGRYLQVFSDKPIKINYIGLVPTDYPITAKEVKFLSPLHQKIYETSVKTLHCCMHEHYEDCPWREQALYNVDSRNEMHCTYEAFGDYEFARFNLALMAQGLREDGLLSICFPAGRDIPIPSFSIMYIVQLCEYIEESKDQSILSETFFAAEKIIDTFISKIEDNGLIGDFPYPCWNFYEWAHGSDNTWQIGRKPTDEYKKEYHLILNVEFLYVLGYYKKLCAYAGKNFSFDDTVLREAIKKNFYDEEEGLYKANTQGEKFFTTLGNSYVVLAGLGGREIIERILNKKDIVPITLSMNTYLYQAMLLIDDKYADFILNDIDKKYKRMLDAGATTFWETELGVESIGHTGSLCHGWSAMPIYYYKLLNSEKYFNGKL